MVAAQRDVLLGYLGGDADAPAPHRRCTLAAPVAAIPQAVPPRSRSRPRAGGPVAATVLEPIVLTVIGERTGYPADMIEPDLDLEADLSIDSIKRTEIAGELATRLGLPAAVDELDERRRAS